MQAVESFALASVLVFQGCQSRKYNSSFIRSTGTPAAASSAYDFWRAAPPVDETKLREWWKYGRNWEPFTAEQVKAIEADAIGDAQFLKDNPNYPVTLDPPSDYAVDTRDETSKSSGSANFNPLQYIRENVATKDRNTDRTAPTPRPVAGRTMLLSLRKLREMAWVVSPGNFGSKPVSDLMNERYLNYALGNINSKLADLPLRTAMIASSGDFENKTLGAIPPHWGDLQGHYYTQTGHILHGCYTEGIGDTSQFLTANNGFIPNKLQRRIVLQMCVQVGEGKDILADWPARYGIVIPNETSFRASLATVQSLAPLFKYFYDTKWVMVKNADGEETAMNVFDYMMLGSVYAFNFRPVSRGRPVEATEARADAVDMRVHEEAEPDGQRRLVGLVTQAQLQATTSHLKCVLYRLSLLRKWQFS